VVGNLMLMFQRGCIGGKFKMLLFQKGCSGGKFNADVPERVLW
jgi:hypothetical protein